MLEDKNYKQVHTSKGGLFKNKEMIRDDNDKQVRTSTVDPLKNKEIFKGKKGKQVCTYSDVVSTEKLSDEIEG